MMHGRILYLNDTGGRGPGPHRHKGAVMEPTPPRQSLNNNLDASPSPVALLLIVTQGALQNLLKL
jgi:hypothetical protein